mmetsp:Transcript_49029/g.151359  ORF Transcript_49029/g.151359 Transcript_49029/m.151359 type:complete len:200 (-) Transcript_49029:823-1422(-)
MLENGLRGRRPDEEVAVVEALYDGGLEPRLLRRAGVDVLDRQHPVVAHEDDGGALRQHLREEDAVRPEEVAHERPRDAELARPEEPQHLAERGPRVLVEEVHAHVREVQEDGHGVHEHGARDPAGVLPDEPGDGQGAEGVAQRGAAAHAVRAQRLLDPRGVLRRGGDVGEGVHRDPRHLEEDLVVRLQAQQQRQVEDEA